jgi:hypothetical protein
MTDKFERQQRIVAEMSQQSASQNRFREAWDCASSGTTVRLTLIAKRTINDHGSGRFFAALVPQRAQKMKICDCAGLTRFKGKKRKGR